MVHRLVVNVGGTPSHQRKRGGGGPARSMEGGSSHPDLFWEWSGLGPNFYENHQLVIDLFSRKVRVAADVITSRLCLVTTTVLPFLTGHLGNYEYPRWAERK